MPCRDRLPAVPDQVLGDHDAQRVRDLTGVVEDTVVEGDKIAARVTWHGIHRGDFVDIPGTGARVNMQSMQILKFTDGMATEWWGTADVFDVLRQVGATVAPPT
jgi:predicted ester cyclase